MRLAFALAASCALLACKEPQGSTPASAAAPVASTATDGGSCIDTWLADHRLNEYGDPPGTMYAGGTPLFDEASGQRKDRVAHVLAKHPALAAACPQAGSAGKDAQ